MADLAYESADEIFYGTFDRRKENSSNQFSLIMVCSFGVWKGGDQKTQNPLD